MEDFIYIILVVVWLLVSFLKKKPKKDQADRRPQPSSQEETTASPGKEVSMEDMLEDFFGGGKKKKEQSSESYQPEVAYEDSSDDQPVLAEHETWEPSTQAVFKEHTGKSGVSDDFEFSAEGKIKTIDELIAAHKKKEALELARAEEEYGGSEGADIPEFNLRDAVIFSEILNKKYS